jgi:2-keto-3-deoxy-L-rhamnonate aldolase RhmA
MRPKTGGLTGPNGVKLLQSQAIHRADSLHLLNQHLTMTYMFITNQAELAAYAEQCGVNRLFVDMEYIGKQERQGHLNTHKAKHTVEDVRRVRTAIRQAELMVRVNPMHDGSELEINAVAQAGADVIMLPMFTAKDEVARFIALVDGRAKVCLLLETPQALVRIDDILSLREGIDEIHIGLNDLHLGMGLTFMFELLSGGIVDYAAEKIRRAGIRFGFGGIARVGEGEVTAELVLSEHVRLGSQMVILSRTFHQNAQTVAELQDRVNLGTELQKLNACLDSYQQLDSASLAQNRAKLKQAVNKVADRIAQHAS